MLKRANWIERVHNTTAERQNKRGEYGVLGAIHRHNIVAMIHSKQKKKTEQNRTEHGPQVFVQFIHI